MSDPASPAAPEPIAPAVAPVSDPAPAVVTEIDIPDDGGFPADPAPDPAPAPEPAAAASADPAPAEPKTIKKSPYQGRIDALTAQRTAAERRAEEAERQAELYKAMAEGKSPPADPNADPSAPPAPSPTVGLVPGSPEFQKAVRDEAARIAAAETAKARTDGLLSAGNADYKDFTERCNVVASLGAGDRADFMQIVTDPTVIPDGHKVIAELAEHPDDAARILALQTVQMTAALVKFQAEISKPTPPKPLSSAPAPIKTIDGQSRGNDEPSDKDDMATYAAKYRKQQAEKLKAGQPARFARH